MRSRRDKPLDSKGFAIGILSATAAILFVGLLILNTRPEPAMASGMTTQAGDWIMTVGRVSVADEEYVYVLDTPGERLIAYKFNTARQQIDIVQGIDLGELRTAGDQDPTNPQRGRRSGSRGHRP